MTRKYAKSITDVFTSKTTKKFALLADSHRKYDLY